MRGRFRWRRVVFGPPVWSGLVVLFLWMGLLLLGLEAASEPVRVQSGQGWRFPAGGVLTAAHVVKGRAGWCEGDGVDVAVRGRVSVVCSASSSGRAVWWDGAAWVRSSVSEGGRRIRGEALRRGSSGAAVWASDGLVGVVSGRTAGGRIVLVPCRDVLRVVEACGG